MLVLSRKVGQKIALGDDIVLVINRIAGNRVSIGIEAPSHVRIVRGELEPIDHDGSEAVAHCGSDAKMSPGSNALLPSAEAVRVPVGALAPTAAVCSGGINTGP